MVAKKKPFYRKRLIVNHIFSPFLFILPSLAPELSFFLLCSAPYAPLASYRVQQSTLFFFLSYYIMYIEYQCRYMLEREWRAILDERGTDDPLDLLGENVLLDKIARDTHPVCIRVNYLKRISRDDVINKLQHQFKPFVKDPMLSDGIFSLFAPTFSRTLSSFFYIYNSHISNAPMVTSFCSYL